jgi:hypothetical protein
MQNSFGHDIKMCFWEVAGHGFTPMVYFSYYYFILFSNPTRKTKIETANRWETTNSKPPGPIIMANQK